MDGIRFSDVVETSGGMPAVAGVSFEVGPSAFFALLGPSGCGRTGVVPLKPAAGARSAARWWSRAVRPAIGRRASSASEAVVPDGEGGAATGGRDDAVARGGEGGPDASEAAGRARALHPVLAPAERRVAVLGSAVRSSSRPVLGRGCDLPRRRAMRRRSVAVRRGRQPGSPRSPTSGRRAAFPSRRRCGTSPERDPVPVDGAPWPAHPPADRNAHPVRMAQVARPRRAAAPVASEGRAERRAPTPDGPVRDVDPTPERALLDDAQAEREAGAEPRDAGDDPAREVASELMV